jgi:hypothetical protein
LIERIVASAADPYRLIRFRTTLELVLLGEFHALPQGETPEDDDTPFW